MLFWTSRDGRESIARLVLDRGAGYLGTALQPAARGGHGAIVAFLLEKGAVNGRAYYQGRTLQIILYYANVGRVSLSWMKMEILRLYVVVQRCGWQRRVGMNRRLGFCWRKGADVDEPCRHSSAGLHCVAASGSEGIIALLLGKGADVHERDIWESTALH